MRTSGDSDSIGRNTSFLEDGWRFLP